MDEGMLYDKRLLERHRRAGLLDSDQIEKHLEDLPDLSGVAARVTSEMSSVGVRERQAEDTGEADDS